jgi:hypothetical protein
MRALLGHSWATGSRMGRTSEWGLEDQSPYSPKGIPALKSPALTGSGEAYWVIRGEIADPQPYISGTITGTIIRDMKLLRDEPRRLGLHGGVAVNEGLFR